MDMFNNQFLKVAIYARVSTEEQMERGSIQNQIEFATKYCDLHQLEIVDFYKDDGITGTLPLEDRTDASRLLEDAKNKKFDMILIYKLDRLGRSARIILNSVHTLEGYGVKIKSMTEPFDTSNPAGKFMLTMLAGVADLERETILERMWHGANRAAREGKWIGGIVPYGYFVNEEGYLEINDNPLPDFHMSEKEVVLLIFDLIANQGYSTIKAADYLNSLKIPTSYSKDNRQLKKGKRQVNTAGIWRPGQVNRIVNNTTYYGVHYYGKRTKKTRDLIEREVPAIVTEETWNKAKSKLKENQIESMRNTLAPYLLRSLIKCKCCGLTYTGNAYKNGGYYKCGGKTIYRGPLQGKCNSKNISKEWIEELVWNDILYFINNPGDTTQRLSEGIDSKDDNLENLDKEKQFIIDRVKHMDIEKESILDLFRKKIITSEDVEKQLHKISEEKIILESRILDIEKQLIEKINLQQQFVTAEDLLKNIKEKLETQELTFELKREIVKTLVKEIIVDTKPVEDSTKVDVSVEINYNFFVGVTRTDMDS